MSSKRILLVDDEHDIREVAAVSMQAVGGWEVCAASSGAEALAKAHPADRRDFEDLGVAGVLSKPFDPMMLPGQVAALLAEARGGTG